VGYTTGSRERKRVIRDDDDDDISTITSWTTLSMVSVISGITELKSNILWFSFKMFMYEENEMTQIFYNTPTNETRTKDA
jgi:hypothetical protein